MTPTDELITAIIAALVAEGLMPAKTVDGLRKKLASGAMTAGDWRNLVSTSVADQEGAK